MISVPLDTLANKLFRNKGKGLSLFLSHAKLRNKTDVAKLLRQKPYFINNTTCCKADS